GGVAGRRSAMTLPTVAEVVDRADAIRQRVRAAGADPATVRLVAVTKGVEVGRIEEVLAAGVGALGESRAQELLAKAPGLASWSPEWHFVGRLQRNKVPALAPHVALWQSVDRPETGEAIARRQEKGRVLVEVNTSGEPQKGGCSPADAPVLVASLRGQGLAVEGLMTVPARGRDPRPAFASLRELAERLELGELSMGMSDDFEVAVEEGATMVRLGRALFGPRPAPPGVSR
ncbi:MAG: YggS family pyridoxal phosphate-dependent enzyme, partial [Acidimicrobiales bacterium]